MCFVVFLFYYITNGDFMKSGLIIRAYDRVKKIQHAPLRYEGCTKQEALDDFCKENCILNRKTVKFTFYRENREKSLFTTIRFEPI